MKIENPWICTDLQFKIHGYAPVDKRSVDMYCTDLQKIRRSTKDGEDARRPGERCGKRDM